MRIIKISSKRDYTIYFDKLGVPEAIAQKLNEYLIALESGDRDDQKKAKFLLRKTKDNPSMFNEYEAGILESPTETFDSIVRRLGFQSEKKTETDYESEVKQITQNKTYQKWVKERIADGDILPEDFVVTKNNLNLFQSLINTGVIPEDERDISIYKTKTDLFEYLHKYVKQQKVKTLEELKKDKIVMKGSTLLRSTVSESGYEIELFRVDTYPAMRLLGAGTSWCVTQTERYFKSEGGPPYYMFFIDGEPEVLAHAISSQIKSPTDNPNFNPAFAKAIDPLIEILGINTHDGDFEIYDRVIREYERYESLSDQEIGNNISKDIGNFIYLDPNKYGAFVEHFVKNIQQIDNSVIENLPKQALETIGKFLRIKNMPSHFKMMEEAIGHFIAEEGHSNYFKSIPKIFRTKNTYENGYVHALKESFRYGGILQNLKEMDKIDPKLKARKDVQEAFGTYLPEGMHGMQDLLRMMLVLRAGSEGTMNVDVAFKDTKDKNKLKTKRVPANLRDVDSILLIDYDKEENDPEKFVDVPIKDILLDNEDQLKENFKKRIGEMIKDRENSFYFKKYMPEALESLTPELASHQDIFEAIREVVKEAPDYYKYIPNDSKRNFRFAVLRGYIDLMQRIREGKEKADAFNLDNVPLDVKRNPSFIKKYKAMQSAHPMEIELKYWNQHLIKNLNSDYLGYGNAKYDTIDYIAEIPEEVLQHESFFPVIIESTKKNGFQYNYLPENLKRNPEVIQAAHEGILYVLKMESERDAGYHSDEEKRFSGLERGLDDRFKNNAEIKKFFRERRIKEDREFMEIRESVGSMRDPYYYLKLNLEKGQFRHFLGTIEGGDEEDEDYEEERDRHELARERKDLYFLPHAINGVIRNMKKRGEYDSFNELDEFFDGKLKKNPQIYQLSRDLVIKKYTEDKWGSIYGILEFIKDFNGVPKNDAGFMSTILPQVEKEMIEAINTKDIKNYSVYYMKNMMECTNNEVGNSPKVYQAAKNAALMQMQKGSLYNFSILDYITNGRLKQDPDITAQFQQDHHNLFNQNWYSKTKNELV
jgi:hypothetical protein